MLDYTLPFPVATTYLASVRVSGSMAASLSHLVETVADYTVDQGLDGTEWEPLVGINGLLATGDDDYVRAAQRLVDVAVETQTGDGQFLYGGTDPLEWTGPLERWTGVDEYTAVTVPAGYGYPALEFYERTGDERYLDAARRQYEYFDSVARTADGGIPIRSEVVELWIDSTYMVAPFFARYGVLTDDPDAIAEAVTQITVHAAHLQDDETGLFRHMWRETPNHYPQGQFWARGNGWAGSALVDTLAVLPEGAPNRDALTDILRKFASAVVQVQDRSGCWRNVLDDPTSPLETSGTLGFAYTLKRGVDLGILAEDPYERAAGRALRCCTHAVDEEGAVNRVAATPGGPGASLGAVGPGWFLLAASRFDSLPEA